MYLNKFISAQAAVMLLVLVGMNCAYGEDRGREFRKLDQSRVLLMNNDDNEICPITHQGYDDTNTDAPYYWWHSDESARAAGSVTAVNLKKGLNHIYYQNVYDSEGVKSPTPRKLWDLVLCYAGSASIAQSTAGYMTIPYGPTSLASDGSGHLNGKAALADNKLAAQAIMDGYNKQSPAIYSPFYEDGIGCIYFDIIHLYGTQLPSFTLEITTNVVGTTKFNEGTHYRDTSDGPNECDWQSIPFDVVSVSTNGTGGAKNATVKDEASRVTNFKAELPHADNKGGRGFYRVRCPLQYKGPIRFRIRMSSTGTSPQYKLVVDNIIATYPAMGIDIKQYGERRSSTGPEALGFEGAFSVPCPAAGQDDVIPYAYLECAPDPVYTALVDPADPIDPVADFALSAPQIHYRWRYLNQQSNDWQSIALAPNSSLPTQLVGKAALDLSAGPGDIEYYFTALLAKAPHFRPFDFVFNDRALNGGTNSFGTGFYELASPLAQTFRLNSSAPFAESLSTDYFIRLREGKSSYALVQLCGRTISPDGKTTNTLAAAAMELVANDTWRYHFPISTNLINSTLQLYFSAQKYSASAAPPFDLTKLALRASVDIPPSPSSLPYSGTALQSTDPNSFISLQLDEATPYLLIELSTAQPNLFPFTIAHAAYQNFNLWTDARGDFFKGYSLNTNDATCAGSAHTKQKFAQDFSSWPKSTARNPAYWEEKMGDGLEALNKAALNTFYPSHGTVKGWLARAVTFVVESNNWEYAVANKTNNVSLAAIQLEGLGQGALEFNDFSHAPNGIKQISFNARVAQDMDYGDFSYAPWLGNPSEIVKEGKNPTVASTYCGYAFASAVQLSKNMFLEHPSPENPSASIIANYDGNGCYELRATLVNPKKLELALYKWSTGDRKVRSAKLLKRCVLGSDKSTNPSDAGTTITSVGSVDVKYYMTPTTIDEKFDNAQYMVLSVETNVTGDVVLTGQLNVRNYSESGHINRGDFITASMQAITYTDKKANNPIKRGYVGVGSKGCQAVFNDLLLMPVTSGAMWVATSGTSVEIGEDDLADNWVYAEARNYNSGSSIVTYPPYQTVEVMLKESETGDYKSFDPPLITEVRSFGLTNCVVTPYTTTKGVFAFKVGEEVDKLTLDDIVVEQWAGEDYYCGDIWSASDPSSAFNNWKVTGGWIEGHDIEDSSLPVVKKGGAAAVKGTDYEMLKLDDGDIVYVFKKPGNYTLKGEFEDLRMREGLVVGGGGGGGAAGGGGGGGQVTECLGISGDMLISKDVTLEITVGAGGAGGTVSGSKLPPYGNFVANPGGAGKESRLAFKLDGTNAVFTALGGGGGGSWTNPRGGEGASSGGAANGCYTYATASAGNIGGISNGDASAGGGGAGERGKDGIGGAGKSGAGDGGEGKISSITGKQETYGSGGGGGACQTVRTRVGDGGTNAGSGSASNGTSFTAAKAGTEGYGAGGGGGAFNFGSEATAERGLVGSAGGAGASGSVILRISSSSKSIILSPKRGNPTIAQGLSSPFLHGLSFLSFSYTLDEEDVGKNASLLLQVCTNASFSTSTAKSIIRSVDEDGLYWETLTNFTFTSALSVGSRSFSIGLREPVTGLVRLITNPEVVRYVTTNEVATAEGLQALGHYGNITINTIAVYDEPRLDERSWLGWNMRITDGDLDGGLYSYLLDLGDGGKSGILNFTGAEDEREIGKFTPEAVANEFTDYDPMVQSPNMAVEHGVGQVVFKARKLGDEDARVVLWGAASSEDDVKDWTALGAFEVTNSVYSTYMWRTTDETTDYRAVRLTVEAASGGRNNTHSEYVDEKGHKREVEGKYIPHQRVALDEISVAEPVAPGLRFGKVGLFRKHLNDDLVNGYPPKVEEFGTANEQPLLGEEFGVQAQIELQQLADQVVTNTFKVTLYYYVGDDVWGFENWTNSANCVKTELVRTAEDALVFRSALKYGDGVGIVPAQEKGAGNYTVVQYMLVVDYDDKEGVHHTHKMSKGEWEEPAWYYPVSLNNEHGGFSAYTMLDSISPHRAWFNCFNVYDGNDSKYMDEQFMELAVPLDVDMSGWQVRVTTYSYDDIQFNGERIGTEERVKSTSRLAMEMFELGYGGVAKEKLTTGDAAHEHNGYGFLTVKSPVATVAENDGDWAKRVYCAGYSGSRAGVLSPWVTSYAFELVRPSGVVEHQVVLSGTNDYQKTSSVYSRYEPEYFKAILDGQDGAGRWVLAGKDETKGTLGVMGTAASEPWGGETGLWESELVSTPQAPNSNGVRTQWIDEDWFLHPNGTNFWVRCYLMTGHVLQQEGTGPFDEAVATNAPLVLIVPANTKTNVYYTAEKFYRVSVSNGTESVSSEERSFAYEITATTNSSIYAYAAPRKDLAEKYGLDENNRYTPAVLNWLQELSKEGDEEPAFSEAYYHPAPWKNEVENDEDHKMTVTQRYWLDINPFELHHVFIGMRIGEGAIGKGIDVPLPDAEIPTPGFGNLYPARTNKIVGVYMAISNDVQHTLQPPQRMRGLGGECSDAMNGAVWTSQTFRVCALYPEANKDWKTGWVALRFFTFDGGSFLPQGHQYEFQAFVELNDPFAGNGPTASNGLRWWWFRENGYPMNAMFFRGVLSDEATPYGNSVLRFDDIKHREVSPGVWEPYER